MIKNKYVVYLQQLKKSTKTTLFRLFIFITIASLASCSSDNKKKEEEVLEKKRLNPNLLERARENADKNPIFNSSRSKSSSSFEFSTSNVLWRASLKTLDFIPLNNTDYSGGVIVTDWYGGTDEQIKISIRFLSNELKSTSIKVISHKKECKMGSCSTKPASQSFNEEIKDKIMNEARAIKIEDDKNKK
jgi:hypothetical protein